MDETKKNTRKSCDIFFSLLNWFARDMDAALSETKEIVKTRTDCWPSELAWLGNNIWERGGVVSFSILSFCVLRWEL
jgi:hypothetical protein